MPRKTIAAKKKESDRWKSLFTSPQHHRQLDEMHERNTRDGRELATVNCWFLGENESERMWREYVGSTEGIAVKSTIGKLWNSVYLPSEVSFIGKVNYVDLESHEMSTYEGGQAHHRAFLKDHSRFAHEQELRIQTMNLRTQACLDPVGRPLSREEVDGKGMNNFDQPGLHVRVKLDELFDTIVTAPGAPEWFCNLIKHLQIKSGINWHIRRSQFEILNVEPGNGDNSDSTPLLSTPSE